MSKQRPFTPEEIAEVRRLVRKCFTGRGSFDDMDRCTELMAISPEEYSTIGDEVRGKERDLLRSM
jgi:hypothetical protein